MKLSKEVRGAGTAPTHNVWADRIEELEAALFLAEKMDESKAGLIAELEAELTSAKDETHQHSLINARLSLRNDELQAENKRLKDSCAYDEARCIELEAENDSLREENKRLHKMLETTDQLCRERFKEYHDKNKRLRTLLSHVLYCDMPEELRFRCEQCTEAEEALKEGG